MRRNNSSLRCLLAAVVLLQTLDVPQAKADTFIIGKLNRLVQETKYHGTEPCTGCDCAIECLAENIDWLEHHIDTYGSIVAKQPDIWGEARLTKHRDEYERVMFAELDDFEATINAAILQKDSSFLAQALALSAAAGDNPPALPASTADAKVISFDPTTNNSNVTAGVNSGIEDRFGIQGADKIGLEPEIELDQLSRYLQHLHELRRINEGDDTSDSPGYSMNLVRIPISVLPGKLTRTGFGAEVTITATPVMSDDLLPTTFKNLVTNDLVDLIGLPLVRTVENFDEIEQKSNNAIVRDELVAILDDLISKIESSDACTDCQAGPTPAVAPPVRQENRRPEEQSGHGDQAPEEEIHPPVPSDVRKAIAVALSYEGFRVLLSDVVIELWEDMQRAANLDVKKILSEGKSINNPGNGLKLTKEEVHKQYSLEAQLFSGKVVRRLNVVESPDSSRIEKRADAHGLDPAQPDAGVNYTGCVTAGTPDKLIELLTSLKLYSHPYCKDRQDEAIDSVANIIGRTRFLQTVALSRLRSRVSESEIDAEQILSIVPTGRARRAANPLNPSSAINVLGVKNILTLGSYYGKAYHGRHIRWNGGKGLPQAEACSESRANLLDAQRWLRDESAAAHEFFAEPDHMMVLAALANPCSGLADAIRSDHINRHSVRQKAAETTVEGFRKAFFEAIHGHCTLENVVARAAEYSRGALRPTYFDLSRRCETPEDRSLDRLHPTDLNRARSPVEALAWAYVVESALLNQRLNDDVRKLAKAKQRYDLETGRDYSFFIPDSVNRPNSGLEHLQAELMEASNVFQRYVEARWPIHVFAIDPREQDQNVADVSARKRELQFTLALGFVTGQIGANSLTQFSRDLETQIETISLNRTIVGFGHGNDTFGWRFQPRVQALPVPGTLGAIRETLCGTSRDYDLKHRQLEPGMRECVAVVLMPSFVPYADFDVRTNWFKLTNPKNAALTMKDTMRLSRAITAMRNSRAQCAKCQHLYRDGELTRLMRRVNQLDRELPLQTQRALVPYENTLGGFEMFNTGVTDLSPELVGWYGAPGVRIGGDACGCFQGCTLGGDLCEGDCAAARTELAGLKSEIEALRTGVKFTASPIPECEGPGTTIFLVGDNFSVHDTKVIAGGVCIPHVQLISRELMRVTIPDCVNTVKLCENGKDNEYVSVYVATPYGVTNHLHVPVHRPQETLAEQEANTLKEALKKMEEAKTNLETDVAEKLSSFELPLRSIALEKTFSTVTYDPEKEAFEFNQEKKTKIEYKVMSNPQLGRFPEAKVQFSVAVWSNGQFISSLAPLSDKPQEIGVCGDFEALTDEAKKLFKEKIKSCLDCNCRCNQPASLGFKLVYYAKAEGESMATRLKAFDLNVRAPNCVCPTVTEASPSPTPAGDSHADLRLLGPSNGDCGCEEARSAFSPQPIRAISHNGPLTGGPVPARFALQVNGNEPLSDPSATRSVETQLLVKEVDELRAKLAEQQQSFEQAVQRLAWLQATGAAAPAQSNVNVTLAYPQTPEEKKSCLEWDKKKHPLVNQASVRARECWHNLRDQLPCN